MGEKEGGLRKLREELEAENIGVRIPAEIRWLGGVKVRAHFQKYKCGTSSAVAAVLGEGPRHGQPPMPCREVPSGKRPPVPTRGGQVC